MKRGAMTLLLAAMLVLTACSALWKQEQEPLQTANFYYLAVGDTTYDLDTGAIYPEVRTLGAEPYDLQEVLDLYFRGPQTELARSPYPVGVTVRRMTLENGTLSLAFSEDWSFASGMEQHLAEACLVLTLTELPGVDAVVIENEVNGTASAPMTDDDFLLHDNSATSDQITVKLYFSDANGRYLVGETRSRSFSSDTVIPEYIVEELLRGPQAESSLAVLPEGTNLLRVNVEEGICTVNFSEAFCTNMPASHLQARMAVFSVVNSLTELPEIEGVRFQCVGNTVKNYAGLDLSDVLYREELALEQSGTRALLDGTLYVPCGDSEKLAPIPVQIRQSTRRSGANAVLNELISFEPANGYTNPFPDGTIVTDLVIKDRLCKVSFNSAFAMNETDTEQYQLAVRAIVATLCAMDEIDRVQIEVLGTEASDEALTEPMEPEAEWLLP